jgi:hypothetical protein
MNTSAKAYRVYVHDQLQDSEDESFKPYEDFATEAEALQGAKQVIDRYLEGDHAKNPNDRPLQLLDSLLDFGYMPAIVGPSDSYIPFNFRRYAEERCYQLCGVKQE